MKVNLNLNTQGRSFGKIRLTSDAETNRTLENPRFKNLLAVVNDISGQQMYDCQLIERMFGYSCDALLIKPGEDTYIDSLVLYANDTQEQIKERARLKNFLNLYG